MSGFLKLYSKNKAINIMLFIIVLSSCFLIAEIVLRSTHIANLSMTEPDSVIVWRYTPNKEYRYSNGENDHPTIVRFNNFGWRDKDRAIEKAPDTYRIAILGDSFVEALQVELDRTFVTLTERSLNKNSNSKVELINFGRSVFTQTEEFVVLKNEVVKYSPDMVILFFLPTNDIEDVSPETALSPLHPFYYLDNSGNLVLDTSFTGTLDFKFKSLLKPLIQNSAITNLITGNFFLYKQLRESDKLRKKRDKKSYSKLHGHLSLATSTPEKVFSDSYRLNKLLIKAMSDYCKERGITFMLVTIDIEAYVTEMEKKYKSLAPSFNANYFEDDMEEYSGQLNIEYLGLQRVFRGYYEKTGIPLHWMRYTGHWNYQGHLLVAKVLSEKIDNILKKKAESSHQFNSEVQHLGYSAKSWYPKWLWKRDISN